MPGDQEAKPSCFIIRLHPDRLETGMVKTVRGTVNILSDASLPDERTCAKINDMPSSPPVSTAIYYKVYGHLYCILKQAMEYYHLLLRTQTTMQRLRTREAKFLKRNNSDYGI